MKRRILFYSHDTFGLGHFRRSLTVASYLARHLDDVAVLMLTGLDSAAAFEPPLGVDFVKLPGVWKSGQDEYRSRHLRVSFARVRRIRRELVRGVVRAFDPHLFVVDNAPRGVGGELLSTLSYLRERRPATRIALTLRDVLDTPENIVPHWKKQGIPEVLEQFYDEIWIAGSRAVFDPPALYEFSKTVRRRAQYCGYVVRASARGDAERLREELRLEDRPRVVVSCGGGGDGFALVDAYAGAAPRLARDGIDSVIFLGPDMPAPQRREIRTRLLPLGDRALVFDFRPDIPAFLEVATVSVSMAGYNTVCEVVASGKPALLVPRTTPRLEQWLRAAALQRLGVASVLHPGALSAEAIEHSVRDLLERAARGWKPALPESIDFAGAGRIARRVRKHLAATLARGQSA
ncbi:MAG: glycosyltransferase [Deltaproteobacteria bacterium]|nr:glycosyltransferase [Deltaproteobacteria bacterium]